MFLRQEDDTYICKCDACATELHRDKRGAFRRAHHYCNAKCVMQAIREGKLTRKTKIIDYEDALKDPRRVKRCAHCDKEYVDVTKRNVGTTCSKTCATINMVATRKTNGSYERSDEQNAKLSMTLKAKYATGEWQQWTPERRALLSERTIRILKGRKYPNHWTKSPEAREKMSEIRRGRKPSDETRAAMSLSAQNRVRTKRETMYTAAVGGHRDDLGIYFRSRWEANFARVMKLQGRTWEYEPHSFTLDDTTTYTPDFFVDGTTYYELKGRWYEGHMEKVMKFREKYPEIPFILIEEKQYLQLSKQYKSKIPQWEGK